MIALAAGIVLDLIIGDPQTWPHPVRWMGRAIDSGRRLIQRADLSEANQRRAGLVLSLILIFGVWGAARFILAAASAAAGPLAWFIGAVMVWWSLSFKDLFDHVRPVVEALASDDLAEARRRLSLIVGRETAHLDRTGVVRAGLETLAESLADGLVAPLFFIVLGGPAMGLAYKAVNTLDSMLGYRHPPFTHLGRWPAKIDDGANWIPARLAFGVILAGAALKGLDVGRAWRAGLSEAGKSSSPNAGWPEAALAGTLDVSLLGPAVYAGRNVAKPFIHEQGRPPDLDDLQRGVGLIHASGLLACGLAVAASLI